jgi:hypothetical protein
MKSPVVALHRRNPALAQFGQRRVIQTTAIGLHHDHASYHTSSDHGTYFGKVTHQSPI